MPYTDLGCICRSETWPRQLQRCCAPHYPRHARISALHHTLQPVDAPPGCCCHEPQESLFLLAHLCTDVVVPPHGDSSTQAASLAPSLVFSEVLALRRGAGRGALHSVAAGSAFVVMGLPSHAKLRPAAPGVFRTFQNGFQGQTAQKTGVFGTLSPGVAPSENGPSAPTKLRIAQ
jgi:hypothetical protein